MPAIRGITVAVGDPYACTLSICLARNMRHLVETVVVTDHASESVHTVASAVPGVRLHVTDAFTRYGASFNKGLALEEGFDVLGRDGWILIHDADILFPEDLPIHALRPDTLHGARRRILDDPNDWAPDLNWLACPLSRDGGAIGFFQLFHAADPSISDKRPWYSVNFPHAGGGDAYFMQHWRTSNHTILPVDVLHLGPRDTNWWGTGPEARDRMAAYVHRMGWTRAMARADPAAVHRVGDLPERIEVPGYETSTFMMPFERRFKSRQR